MAIKKDCTKGALRTIFNDHESTFEFLLTKNDDTNIHSKYSLVYLTIVMVEINKTHNHFYQNNHARRRN